jgi:multidrug efflux system membrane fusion protein
MHGSKLTVQAYDRNDSHKIAEGKLLTIDNQIDTTTGTAKLKAVFDNTDNALFPNQFVNVRLILHERQNATVVPTAAVQSGTQGTFVFVVHPGPTPANKVRDGGGAGGAGGGGGHKGGGKPAGGGAPAATGGGAPDGGAPADAGAANAPKFHVDTVQVHVDFAQGSNSVLADGALHNGDQVVVDGQEKLTDGSNVSPTHGNPPAGTGKGSGVGAQTPAPPGGSMPSATPQPGQAQPPNGGRRRGGNPNGAGSGGGEAE